MKYDFPRKYTSQRTVFALTLDRKKLTERIVIADASEALNRLNGGTGNVYFDQTRPLGSLLFGFESDVDNLWEKNASYLRKSYGKTFPFEGERWKTALPAVDYLRDKYDTGEPSAMFTAVRTWEHYLYCFNQSHGAELFSQGVAICYRLFTIFGRRKIWRDEDTDVFKPVSDADTQVELWYPAAKRPFECIVAHQSLMPIILYYLNKVREWNLVFQECKICGSMFLARSRHYELCSDKCRKVTETESKREFDERAKGDKLEQFHETAYNYWYNRIRNLKRHNAAPEKIAAAQAAFGDYRKEAVRRKSEVKRGESKLYEFSSWLVKQQGVIDLLTREE